VHLSQHDEKYRDAFWNLTVNYGYGRNMLNAKIDCPVEDNHSDNELLFLAYHIMFYSLDRLSSEDPNVATIREEVCLSNITHTAFS
jgi:hypothetical protein